MLIFGHIGLTIAIIYTFQRTKFPGLVLDYRPVILGSLLPDIIDKPIGYILFQRYYENGWIYGHTLLFSLLLLILSYFIKTKYLMVGLASLLLLIEDGVAIYMPRTFLWPLLGWSFDKNEIFTSKWIEYTISGLYTNEYIQITELAGAAIIFYLFLRHKLYIKSNLLAFIKNGNFIERRY